MEHQEVERMAYRGYLWKVVSAVVATLCALVSLWYTIFSDPDQTRTAWENFVGFVVEIGKDNDPGDSTDVPLESGQDTGPVVILGDPDMPGLALQRWLERNAAQGEDQDDSGGQEIDLSRLFTPDPPEQ